ncbi:MAG: DUF2878 domain-containing protein [bacterium]
MDRLTLLIINFLVFHTCWLANAFGAAHDITLLGPAFILPGIVLHLLLIDDLSREAVLIVGVATVGYVIDALHLQAGVLNFKSGQMFYVFPPVWMFFQWMIFATLFRLSLDWLKGRYWAASILGAVGGPFSYWAAAQLDAIMIKSLGYSLTVMAVSWALLMPAFIWYAHRGSENSQIPSTVVNKEAV